MADAINAGGGPGEQDPDIVRANVNGRTYRIRREDGLIERGPKRNQGKYLSSGQLDRIIENPDYHGHLVLADSPDQRRLAEAEFLLMEHREKSGIMTLVEGMVVTYQGQPGWRIGAMDEKTVMLVNGNTHRKVSRQRLERETHVDYEQTLAQTSGEELFESTEPEMQSGMFDGNIEIPDDILDSAVQKYLDDNLPRLIEAYLTAAGNTSESVGEQPDQCAE